MIVDAARRIIPQVEQAVIHLLEEEKQALRPAAVSGTGADKRGRPEITMRPGAGVAGQTWFQSLVVSSNGRIMPGAGALPIVEGGSVVGAIAVAGGTEEQDQRCAEVALASYV